MLSAWLSLPAAAQFADVGLAHEHVPLATSVALARGGGVVMELELQSFPLPAGLPPQEFRVAPVLPRLSVGGAGGRELRWALAAHGVGSVPLDGLDPGLGGGISGGVSVGVPDQTLWLGLEADLGLSTQGALGEAHRQLAVSVDTVASADVDATTSVFLRFGGTFVDQRSATALGNTIASGLGPRIAAGAGYRPDDRTLVSVAGRLAVRGEAPRVPITAVIGLGYRLGPPLEPPPPPAPIVPVASSQRMPSLPVVSHPLLRCDPPTLAVGQPPPYEGLKAWCVRIEGDGRIVQHGMLLRWHDASTIAEKGSYDAGKRHGAWTTYYEDSTLKSEGSYIGGKKDGLWRTFHPDGSPASLGRWLGGKQVGRWEYFDAYGNRTEGMYEDGLREGDWITLDPEGNEIRLVNYQGGVEKYRSGM
ncbi:MAG TPA: hypothetical protein ENK18_05910 [Deltaproteobacteria bacterium]|nr:hypothetical protein [Deltaproteobacteria bacterium]